MPDIPVYSYEDLRKKADEFLLKHHPSGAIPIPIEEIVEFEFVKMPNQGGYSFPYSYKPAKTGKTHTANENFNPDYFIRMHNSHDILVVEVKAEGDDSNRNRAKCRDGLKHFDTLNARLAENGEPWRYHFCFLSPEDYTSFFTKVREKKYAGWKSGLMQQLA